MAITLSLLLFAAYTLYFYWLVSTDEQATMHAYELADADKHSRVGLTVNDYFFNDNYEA